MPLLCLELGTALALSESVKETEGTTANQVATTPRTLWGGRLDRHAGRHEQTYESRVRAGRHP